MTDTRALDVTGLVNARDLGGLPLVGGGLTPRRVFYRSESVDRVGVEGWQQLRELGVRTLVDLRQPVEQARDTGVRPPWLTTVPVNLDGPVDLPFWADYWANGLAGTASYYLPHLAEMPERAGAALTALARAEPGGVLFHCEAGRDRTGLVALLLLALIGAEPDAIVEDYLETIWLGPVRAAAIGETDREPEVEERCRRMGLTTEGAFREALAGLDVEDLLVRAGLAEDVIDALRTWRGAAPTTRADADWTDERA